MTVDIKKLKDAVVIKVDEISEELKSLSIKIHQNPELAFKEEKASIWLTELLVKYGFKAEKGIGDLPTAFRAIAEGKMERPSVGILAEYDALPGLGHACGHNIMATAGPGAAIAVKLAIPELPGRVTVFGTPAEENGGGKVLLAKKGIFKNLDAAMIVHPAMTYEVNYISIACQTFRVEFFGKSAHAAAAPEKGINALDAMINSFNMINALRQHVKPDVRIHGIITYGGEASNIVPKYSSGEFTVRSTNDNYMDELLEKVLNIFKASASATGCTVKFDFNEARYATMQTNQTLANAFADNMRILGLPVQERDMKRGMGSSDMGNVSHEAPSVHPYIKIAEQDVSGHTPEFCQAAVSEMGHKGLLDAAKVMAMTTIDVLFNEELRTKMKDEFEKNVTPLHYQ
jgi:amidohydrolase